MRRIASALLILILLLLPVCSFAQSEPLGFGFVNARDVALRANMGGTITGRLPKGTCVWIRDTRTDRAGRKWYEINAGTGVDADGTETEYVEQAGGAGETEGRDLRGWTQAISNIRQVGLCAGGKICYAVGLDGTCYDSAGNGEEHPERIYAAGGKHRIWEITTDYRLKTGESDLDWIYPQSVSPEQLSHVAAVADSASKLLLLTDDGRVYAANWQQEGEDGPEPDWENWTDVISLDAASCRFAEDGELRSACAAVRKDGTVLAAPEELSGLIGSWTNMAKIVIGEKWVLGLKRDGTVVSAGIDGKTPPDVSAWSDIMDLGTGKDYCVGVRSSGNLVFAGDYRF